MQAHVTLEGAEVVHRGRATAGSLTFENGTVAACATPGFRVDLTDHAVFPGLLNAHDHLQLNNVPPLEGHAPFSNSYEWIAAMESHRCTPVVRAATSVPSEIRHWHGGLKNILAGTTTVAHHDPRVPAIDAREFPVDVPRIGWCHSLALAAGDLDAGGHRYGPPVRPSFDATPDSLPWVTHLAEGTDDVARGELTKLDALGCLASNAVLVHGVGLTSSDIDRVVESGASVVWCPASNLRMFARTVDVDRLDAAGRVAIGTDSRLTGSRDLLDELRVAASQTRLSPQKLVRMVTDRAAAILRLGDRGRLSVGARADCVIIRNAGDPCESLLHTRRADIRAVVRSGVPVIADPDFADWFAVAGIDTTLVALDGRPKLIATSLVDTGVAQAACALEPGLEIGVLV
jgi:cytosine/adenosine deaminase-related metal-dependent hydrolase